MFNCPFKVLGETYTALMGLTWADVQLTLYRWAQYIGVVELFGPFWEVVNGFYEEHKASLDWVFPRGPGLQGLWNVARNTNLHLGTGVSVGVLASVLILLYIHVLSRFLPSKLKSLCYVLMTMGIGLVLQFIGLVLIPNWTQIREVSVAHTIVTLTVFNLLMFWHDRYFNNQSSRNLWYRFFPPKIQLLTEEEYIQQGNIHTQAELEKLRDYCRSPDCKAWKVISRLNSPHKFADFIEGNSWHVTSDELLEYESGPDPIVVSDDDDDNISEADFMLSSQ